MTARSKSKRKTNGHEPAISIPLSKLAELRPSLRRIIGGKKKLSASDNSRILKALFKPLKTNGLKLPRITSMDGFLDWFERKCMGMYAEALLKGDYEFCRTVNALMEFYRAKYSRQIYTGKYHNYDISKLPIEWKKRIAGATTDKQLVKILDEFESSKNTK